MVIWALFDSGNGCHKQAVDKYYPNDFEIYSIGLDIKNKNDHFLNLDLADYSELFQKESNMFERLDQLPKPDLILASPPCESWSTASSVKQGNVCWYTQEASNLLGVMKVDNHFTIQTKKRITRSNIKRNGHFQTDWDKSVLRRINGELCAFNTMRIIQRYNPKIWIIENPQGGGFGDITNKFTTLRVLRTWLIIAPTIRSFRKSRQPFIVILHCN